MNWNDILKQYSNHALSAMCKALRIDEYAVTVNLASRQRVIDRLRQLLGKPDTLRLALHKIGPVETAIVDVLIRMGAHGATDEVRRAVEAQSPIRLSVPHPAVTPEYQGVPSFDDAVARATCYGLVFSRDNREIDLKPGKYLFIPEPVLAVITADAEWQKTLARLGSRDFIPVAVPTPDIVLSASAADFQRDLSRYLRHVRKQDDVALTTLSWIYKSNFKTFLAALNAPEDAPGDEASNARLWFMRRLLTAMGELVIEESGMSANPAGTLLTLPMAQRVKLAFESWCDTGAWNELNRIATDHSGYDYRRDAPPELSKARGVIMRMIARVVTHAVTAARPGASPDAALQAPAGKAGDWLDRWLTTAQLIELTRRTEYQFLLPRKLRYRDLTGGVGLYNTPYISTNNNYGISFPAVRDEKSGWDEVERQVIVNMLTGPLYWMGLVSLGYLKSQDTPKSSQASQAAGAPHPRRGGSAPGEGVEPAVFRLTSAGAWLLGLAEQPEFIESGGRVLVQPNFTVIAMEPVSDAVLIALDEFADSQGGDRAVTYHLTRQSVYRAQRLGWTSQRIRAFLELHQGGAIPANIQRSLDEWQNQHQRITFYRSARVVQYADEAAREGANDALRQAGVSLRALSPTFDIVEPAPDHAPALETLNTALSDAGWMPLLTAGDGDPAQTAAALRVNENGDVAFKQAVPSIFALSQLQPFTERSGDRIRISAPSVRAAMSKGMPLDELLATLAHLNDGPLPARVETSIRAWAGFYGDAALLPVHLLELSSQEVLNNLLQDGQVGQYLKSIEGSLNPLALVDNAHVEFVRAVLLERGVTVR